jgi:hypothetical protein
MNDMVQRTHSERGAVLLGVMLIMFLLTLLGMVSMNLATQEVLQIADHRDDAVARHLAESGSDMIVQWFHDTSATPETAAPLLGKRYDLPDSGPSFFDAVGRSQFSGSSTAPDLLYDATRAGDDSLLNDPSVGWFRGLSSLGSIQTLKIYGPTRPGLLCSVEVTAKAKRHSRTISMQLGAVVTPPLRAGVQIGNNGSVPASSTSLPILVHWGDLKAKGNTTLGRREDFPTQTAGAAVTGQSYADMVSREDRWFTLWAGGDVFFTPSSISSTMLPSNVYPRREPFPGIQEDVWPYEVLKKHAIQHGSYYTRDTSGLLYRNGIIGQGLELTIEQVFRSQVVGHNRGLVFIDTLDRLPPSPDNLGTLLIDTDYMEGLFVVNAHVQFKPQGNGKSVQVLSPPNAGSSSIATRIPITLSGIHLNGLLSTPGDLSYEGQPRIFGALVVDGRILPSSNIPVSIEVWYDHDFRNGFFRGLPIVYVASGTWQEKY